MNRTELLQQREQLEWQLTDASAESARITNDGEATIKRLRTELAAALSALSIDKSAAMRRVLGIEGRITAIDKRVAEIDAAAAERQSRIDAIFNPAPEEVEHASA